MTDTATPQKRIFWIDVIRGIAIILMIPANLAPFLTETHPLWFRIIGSYAAPTFIALSAGMVVLRAPYHDFAYYLKRGGLVLLVGVLLDTFLWRIYPFTSVDVLYVIGPGIPVVYLAHKRSAHELSLIGIVLLMAGPVLQSIFPYDPTPLQVYFKDAFWPGFHRLASSWFIDGWFPIIPWSGFVFIGAALAKSFFGDTDSSHAHRLLWPGLALAAAGFLFLFSSSPYMPTIAGGEVLTTREGYSEIFYPPSLGYLMSAVGIILALTGAFAQVGKTRWDAFPAYFGRYSMFVYIMHQVLGELVIKPILGNAGLETVDSGWIFLAINIEVFAIIAVLCMMLDVLKRKWPPKNLFVRVLIGQ
jgi:uncharacterized membrane protein